MFIGGLQGAKWKFHGNPECDESLPQGYFPNAS